ncbi:MAG: hypothetical protein R3190_09485, partial [Thermoanaerobaculia bacterium]|nr:hypothetical protein [Thermoanaerobaculia bacterium]
EALRRLAARLEGGTATGPLASVDGLRLHAFVRADGSRWVAAWRPDDRPAPWRPPSAPAAIEPAHGPAAAVGEEIVLSGTPLYLDVAAEDWPRWQSTAVG